MEKRARVYRVFIATPSDLTDERKIIKKVVDRLNVVFGKETDVLLELLGWEDTLPGGGRPQGLINADLDKADLFIGCVWKKMGSASGSGDMTGFEEEFHRANDRFSRSGSPERWLFFKEIAADLLIDPGVQLARVLEFRKSQIAAKELLFKEFVQPEDWEDLIYDLLNRQLLRWALSDQQSNIGSTRAVVASANQTQPSESNESPEPTEGIGLTDELQSLAKLLGNSSRLVKAGALGTFDRSTECEPKDISRLLLFASATYDWRIQHIELGVHEINSIYGRRLEMKLGDLERLFLMRTMILDRRATKPAWYWNSTWGIKVETWVVWFAARDTDPEMRQRMITLATNVGLRFETRGAKRFRVLDRLLGDSHPDVRLAALAYACKFGGKREVRLIGNLLHDTDKKVREAAMEAAKCLALRLDFETELTNLIAGTHSFTKQLIELVESKSSEIPTAALANALQHPNAELRTIAASEIVRRELATHELSAQLIQDDDARVRRWGYVGLVKLGSDINAQQLRQGLRNKDVLSFIGSVDTTAIDETISLAFDRLPGPSLLDLIGKCDGDSALAVKAFFRSSGSDFRAWFQMVLATNFSQIIDKIIPKRDPQSIGKFSVTSFFTSVWLDPEACRQRLRVAALEALSTAPIETDRSVFLQCIVAKDASPAQVCACLIGLKGVGIEADREVVRQFIQSPTASIRLHAAEAFIATTSSIIVAAKELLDPVCIEGVGALFRRAIQSHESGLAEEAELLLRNDDEHVRRAAYFYLTETQSKTRLTCLLDRYGRDAYYYNVVVLLDRALFAPAPIRSYYREQESRFLQTVGTSESEWSGIPFDDQ